MYTPPGNPYGPGGGHPATGAAHPGLDPTGFTVPTPPRPGPPPPPVRLAGVATIALAGTVVFATALGILFHAHVDEYLAEHTVTAVAESSPRKYLEHAVNVLWAVALIVVAVFVLRGLNHARSTAFVLHGVAIACGLLNTAMAVRAFQMIDNMAGSGSSRLDDLVPGWYLPGVMTTLVLYATLPIVSIVLLSLPRSNAWFAARSAARLTGYRR